MILSISIIFTLVTFNGLALSKPCGSGWIENRVIFSIRRRNTHVASNKGRFTNVERLLRLALRSCRLLGVTCLWEPSVSKRSSAFCAWHAQERGFRFYSSLRRAKQALRSVYHSGPTLKPWKRFRYTRQLPPYLCIFPWPLPNAGSGFTFIITGELNSRPVKGLIDDTVLLH